MLDDGSLHQLVVDLERESARLSAARARVVALWDTRRTWADDGSKAPSGRLARECRMSLRQARAELRQARALRHMPATAAAFAAGAICADHVAALAGCCTGRFRELFTRDEPHLVTNAQRLSFRGFAQVLALWRQCADAAADSDRAAAQHEDRHLNMSCTFEGTFDIQGRFDALDGSIVDNELRRLEQQLFDADWADARERCGPTATPSDLARTPGQRRADALVEMARRSAAMHPDAKHARVLITILWGAGSFRDRLCETDRGVVLKPAHVLPHLTEADIERIVFDGPSRVIDVGMRQRFFTGALRRAIEVRDRHCTHPSECHAAAPDCHVDHIIDYEHNGPTTQENGRLLCPVHNRTRRKRPPPPPRSP